ncbi:FdtA/QdtA family cupin domain-containing protein [Gammaproteobacteria bacterium]|nr:FdtA/QdtA family cupin domain-containing protein [Gammaproteobacteria bacterium]
MSISKFYDFPNLGDTRGSLVAIDSSMGLPFEIKRTYFIFGTKSDVLRGQHAHKRLHQVAVCLSGSCKMVLDNGKKKEEITMDSPLKGIDIPPMVWHEMYKFSSNCILLVLASDYYNEEDYIRNYDKFNKALDK